MKGETIRQIAMYGIETGDSTLNSKIYQGFEVFGLYPYEMKAFNMPDEKR